MSFRACLRMRSMLPLAIIVGGLISLTQPALASAFPVINIHLTNAPSYCVNRQGGGNSQVDRTVGSAAGAVDSRGWLRTTLGPAPRGRRPPRPLRVALAPLRRA
jgi:hypothetical protein